MKKLRPSKQAIDLFTRLWPLSKLVHRLGRQPLVGLLLRPLFTATVNEAVIIPVQEAVRGTESVVLPYPLLVPLVERASLRFVMNECLCRKGSNCQTYSHGLGCIMLGDGAAEINPAMGRLVGAAEAMTRVRRAMETGLVPVVVRAAIDRWLLGVSHHRMLALCFCCECCCAVWQGLRLGPPVFWDTVSRLPGLTVTAGPGCTGCGRCVDECYVHAISRQNGRVFITDQCKGCGRCAAICPAGAITLLLERDTDVLDGLLTGIGRHADIRTAGDELASGQSSV